MFVTIRHNHISGSRQVLVNGVPIPFTRGTTGIWQSQDEIVFKTEDGLHTIRVMILNDVINNLREKFLYAVTIDGEECKPCDVLRDKLIDDLNSSNPDQQSMVAGQPAYDPSLAYTIRISIDSHKVSTENFEKKPVALFRVTTTRTNTEDPDVDNEVSVSWYRFSEMLELNGVLKTSYKQSHLQSSFPEFPPRCYDPRVLQFEEPFLLERREVSLFYISSPPAGEEVTDQPLATVAAELGPQGLRTSPDRHESGLSPVCTAQAHTGSDC